MADMIHSFKSLGLFLKGPQINVEQLISDVERLAQLARKDGFLALEKEVANLPDPFLAKGIQMLVEKGKLNKMPEDPWGKPYISRRPGTKDKGGFDVYSAGEDGIPDNADDIGSWDL